MIWNSFYLFVPLCHLGTLWLLGTLYDERAYMDPNVWERRLKTHSLTSGSNVNQLWQLRWSAVTISFFLPFTCRIPGLISLLSPQVTSLSIALLFAKAVRNSWPLVCNRWSHDGNFNSLSLYQKPRTRWAIGGRWLQSPASQDGDGEKRVFM